jgi:hypothetical protein
MKFAIVRSRSRDRAKGKNSDRADRSLGEAEDRCNREILVTQSAILLRGETSKSFQDLVSSYPAPGWTHCSDRGDFSIGLTSFLAVTSVLAFPSAFWTFQHLPRCTRNHLSTIIDGCAVIVMQRSVASRDSVENDHGNRWRYLTIIQTRSWNLLSALHRESMSEMHCKDEAIANCVWFL